MVEVDIERLQSVGLIIIRPKNPQSDRKSDRLTMFRPKTDQYNGMSDTDIQYKPKEKEICY